MTYNLQPTTKNKKLKRFVLVVCCLLFVVSFHSALAQSLCNEVPLPLIGTGNIKPCESPAAYIAYWFYFSLYLAGIAALLAMVGGGVLWMISGTVSSAQKGKHMMSNALLGLILLFGGWLVLHTLNPALTNVQNPSSFGIINPCFANFIPRIVVAGKHSLLFWTVADKDVKEVLRVCKNDDGSTIPGQAAFEQGVSPDGKGLDFTITKNMTCIFRGIDKKRTTLERCSASVLVDPGCRLSQRGKTLTWEITTSTKDIKSANITCDTSIMTTGLGGLAKSVGFISGSAGSVPILLKDTACHIELGFSDGSLSANSCSTAVKAFPDTLPPY